MIRAKLRLIRQFLFAVILLGLLLCGAEVGVRVYEVVQGKPVCAVTPAECLTDPARLTVPSWLTNLELKPQAFAELKCRDRKMLVELQTNSMGFRGSEVAIPKPADSFRVVVLGDETVFAPETPDEDHFTHRLTAILQERTRLPVEVINAGLPGGCPLTEYLMFKQKLLALQPDLVVMHYDWSDVADDRQLRRRTRSDSRGIPISCPHLSLQGTSRKPHPLDHLRQQFRLVDLALVAAGNKWKQQISDRNATSRDVATNAYAWLRNEHPESDVAVTQSFRPIADLAHLAQGARFRLVVMTSPKPWQVSARCSCGAGVRVKSGVSPDAYYPNRAPFDALEQYVLDLHLPYLDLSGTLLDVDKPEANYLRHAPRWSATGHDRVAETLARFLLERVLKPRNSRYIPPQDDQEFGRRPQPRNEIQWASGVR